MATPFRISACIASLAIIGLLLMAPKNNSSDKRDPDPLNQNVVTTAKTSKKFAALCEAFVKDSLVLSPSAASAAGYHIHKDASGKTIELDALLDDLSLDSAAKQRDFYADWRERFHRETPASQLTPEDAADFQLIDDQIGQNLLEFDEIQNYRHNPTFAVELIGNAVFLPLTQDYAPKEVRLGHALSRIGQIPRALDQVKQYLNNADPIYISTAIDENAGNVDLIQNTVAKEIGNNEKLKEKYQQVAPPAIAALNSYSAWLKNELAQKPSNRDWRLRNPFYEKKFKLVMESDITPAQLLSDAEAELKSVRAEMLQLALPMHAKMYPDHTDHSDLTGRDRENKIIGEVLQRISDDHPRRDQLQQAIEADLESIKQFIREKKIVSLGDRDNLKVIPTPPFMRGIYSVAGFHGAPPLEPNAEAEYWVTPIDPSMPEAQAESKLREYNNFTLKWLTIHEALPGHYVQGEHANNIQPESRRLVRALFSNGAYVEGWAEYIAQVMMDTGFLNNDPRFRMVMRKIRLRVLGNTILDIRMHTMNMTDQQAMDLMTHDCFQTKAEADGKLARAKLSSAQLPTYYLGIREWFKVRHDYQTKAGKNFDMMKFHNLVLDEGALPVPEVGKLVMATLE
jgi:uncharacterized protein (DUF885 family)